MSKIDIDFDYSKVKGSTQLHNKFKAEFKLVVDEMFPNCMVLPYDVAKVRALSNPEIIYQVNQKGVLDTLVLLKNKYLWFDQKTGKAVLQPNQKSFVRRVNEINSESRAFKINTIREGVDIIMRHYGE